MSSKTSLVVGGAGYIGSHLCKALKADGVIPVVLDNFSTGYKHNVKYGPCVEANMGDSEAVLAAIKHYNPDDIFIFAACIEVGEGEKDPLKFYKNNVANALSLINSAVIGGVKNIIFSSTCATYGTPLTQYLDETHPQNPVSVYGRTKLMVETILKDVSKANGIRFSALRYFNASGADPDGELGEEHDPESHLIPNVLASIEGRRDMLNIFGDDYDTKDGTCVRDYIHVCDLAEAHINAAQYIKEKDENLILNLGTGNGASVLEIMKKAEEVTGKPCPYILSPRRVGDPPYLVADSHLAKEKINFNPQRSNIETILQDAYNFHIRKWK